MDRLRELASEIVDREGGFVNDPDDPGGPTKYGVTLGTMRSNGLDVTGDGRIDIADVRALGRERAIALYLDRYWHRPHLDMLPEPLQPPVFDMYVNAGATAVKILQRLLRGQGAEIADDGMIGPRTLAAVRAASAGQGAEALAQAYSRARRDFYYALADARPASRKYARRRDGGKGGWIRRAEEFLPPEQWLSEAEHRQRTSRWP